MLSQTCLRFFKTYQHLFKIKTRQDFSRLVQDILQAYSNTVGESLTVFLIQNSLSSALNIELMQERYIIRAPLPQKNILSFSFFLSFVLFCN